MRTRTAIAASGLLGLTCLGASYVGAADVPAESKPATRPPGEIGRYQAAGGDQNEIWLVDTTTGECWRAHTRGETREWERLVPPLAAHPKEARPDKL